MRTEKRTCPTAFKAYVLDGDAEGLSPEDIREADSWLGNMLPFEPVSVDPDDPGGDGDYGFFHKEHAVVPVTTFICEAPDLPAAEDMTDALLASAQADSDGGDGGD